MKRFTFFLTLLLSFIFSSVSAQRPQMASKALHNSVGITTQAATGVKANATNVPTVGKYYFITCAFNGFETKQGVTKSIYVDGTTVKWGTTDYENANMYWQIYEEDGKYVFKNYGTDEYISTYSNSKFSVGETPASNVSLTWNEDICYISVAGGRFHCDGHYNGAGKSGNVIQYGTYDAGASQWYIQEVDAPTTVALAKQRLQNCVNKYASYTGTKLGNNPGQYSVTGGNIETVASAISAAQEVLNGGSEVASDYDNAFTALKSFSFTKNTMIVGKYYRIQSTTRKTYTGIEFKSNASADSQMRNSTLDEQDPRQIWKLEQEGEGNSTKYYLVNLASGLYPQHINSGTASTSDVGEKNSSYAFSWGINTEATTTEMPTYNIFFGGTQVNIETDGNVNYWYGENAHQYIWKVEKTDEELRELVENWISAQGFTNNVNAKKIALNNDVAQIISPSEFAAPATVNASIDALKNYADAKEQGAATIEQTQAIYKSNKIVDTYRNAVNNYGEILSVPYSLKAQYGTIILPINYVIPNNVKLYSCDGETDGVLTLTEARDSERKNKPYIVEYTDEATMPTAESAKTYQLIGYKNGAATTNQTVGWLTGVLEDEQYVPNGSYILAKHNDKIGFYQVDGDNVMAASKYKCYLTAPISQATKKVFFFDNNHVTGIANIINNQEGKTTIYDLSGKRLSHLQKGINIVNGQKVMVK